MDESPGARLATLLRLGFNGMVDEVVTELERQGHPGVTASLEFALDAIDNGARDASALGRALGVTKQAAAKTIATLEQLGYVHRDVNPDDQRRMRLVVTPRGHDMTTRGAKAFDDLRREWVATVGARDAATAERALEALLTLRQRGTAHE